MIRKRDINDLMSSLSAGIPLSSQIIFRDSEELSALVANLKVLGVRNIDLNMGCPFPPQTAKGRGAATISNLQLAREVESVINDNPDITFSVKMRLGLKEDDEWKQLLPFLNRTRLKHIALHPRVAKEQYSGELHMEAFGDFLRESANPVIFNGEIKTPEDISEIEKQFPALVGIMIGRGLLARPSLAMEYTEHRNLEHPERLRLMLEFHNQLLKYYSETLEGGEHQVLSKIQPFWEYAEPEIGRKPWKAIRKASNMARYHTAVAMIQE